MSGATGSAACAVFGGDPSAGGAVCTRLVGKVTGGGEGGEEASDGLPSAAGGGGIFTVAVEVAWAESRISAAGGGAAVNESVGDAGDMLLIAGAALGGTALGADTLSAPACAGSTFAAPAAELQEKI